MLRATTDLMVNVLVGIVAVAAVLAILRGGFGAAAKIAHRWSAPSSRSSLLKTFDAKFWGVVVMGGAVMILFFLPWLDRSPVQVDPLPARLAQVRVRRSSWSSSWCSATSARSRRRPIGNYVSQIGTLVYFGFFLLMPWWSRIGTFKPVPERVHVRRPLTAAASTTMKKLLISLLVACGFALSALRRRGQRRRLSVGQVPAARR